MRVKYVYLTYMKIVIIEKLEEEKYSEQSTRNGNGYNNDYTKKKFRKNRIVAIKYMGWTVGQCHFKNILSEIIV